MQSGSNNLIMIILAFPGTVVGSVMLRGCLQSVGDVPIDLVSAGGIGVVVSVMVDLLVRSP